MTPADKSRRRRKPPEPGADGFVPGDYGDEIDWFAQLRSTGQPRRDRPFGRRDGADVPPGGGRPPDPDPRDRAPRRRREDPPEPPRRRGEDPAEPPRRRGRFGRRQDEDRGAGPG
ncbi:MAG: hypothetical protein ACRDT6_19260, partial [Micromonosporaceae bacterium]